MVPPLLDFALIEPRAPPSQGTLATPASTTERAYIQATDHRVWLSSNAVHHHPPRHTPLEHQVAAQDSKGNGPKSRQSPLPLLVAALQQACAAHFTPIQALALPSWTSWSPQSRRLFPPPPTSSTPHYTTSVRPIHDSLGLNHHYRATRPAFPKTLSLLFSSLSLSFAAQ